MSRETKRQRTEDNIEIDQSETKRSYLWFEDGNVVLQAEHTLFRVHRSVLSLHSAVFSDMFSIPLPTNDFLDPVIGGCPVVALSDKAEDVTCMLSRIYENHMKYDCKKQMPVSQAVALFRLGKKYQIDHLCDEVLHRLKLSYPCTLADWDGLSKRKSLFSTGTTGDDEEGILESHGTDSKVTEIFANLAHEFQIQTILPALYACLSSRTNESIFLRKKTLSQQVAETCIIGKEKLMNAALAIVRGRAEFVSHSPLCETRKSCRAKIPRVLFDLPTLDFTHGVSCLSAIDPDIIGYGHTGSLLLCRYCNMSVFNIYEQLREMLWEDLPSFFGLPNWKELKDY